MATLAAMGGEEVRARLARLWSQLKARIRRRREDVVVLPGIEPVAIAPLISPLRFDVLVRRDWFEFRASQRERFDADFDALFEASAKHPYGTWFREVVARTVHPEYLASEQRFRREFAARLRRSSALQDSFDARGFDAVHPIALSAGVRVHPTASGKRVTAAFYAGNGCHRLALLLRAGRERLEPGEYVVRRAVDYTPRDNTGLLLEVLGVRADDYYRFVSMGYEVGESASREDLLEQVSSREPERLAELEHVLQADEPHLLSEPCP
jgi:hypothetical protein